MHWPGTIQKIHFWKYTLQSKSENCWSYLSEDPMVPRLREGPLIQWTSESETDGRTKWPTDWSGKVLEMLKHNFNPNDTGKRYPAFSTLVLRITNCQGLEDNKQIGKPCYWQTYNDIKYWNVLTMVPIATTAWKGKSVLPVFSLCYLWSDRSSLRMVCRFLTIMPVYSFFSLHIYTIIHGHKGFSK